MSDKSIMMQYQELIEALEIQPGAAAQVTSKNKSNMQVLAKAQVCNYATNTFEENLYGFS